MNNKEIRKTAKNAGVYLWQIAEALGIRDTSFSRELRHELSDKRRAEVFRAIDRLKEAEV